MSADPNKKSPRTFQCRDMLWDNFEQMARELECSVDYLINDAMKQYARQRSMGATSSSVGASPLREPPQPQGFPRQQTQGFPPPQQQQRRPVPPPPGSLRAPPLGGGGRLPPPQPAGFRNTQGGGGGMPVPPPPRQSRDSAPPPGYGPPLGGGQPQRMGQTPPPRDANGYRPASMAPQRASLSVTYNGERLSVNKERFVIGRGKQSSDLTLKDPNVSRQHAMVEYQNGVYYMVDMGSTNGVEYNGQRIARKPIAEGDIFRICDHEIRFSFR